MRDKKASLSSKKVKLYQYLNCWLGREDSNLRMAESKSAYFFFGINGHSEKIGKFESLSINGLALDFGMLQRLFQDSPPTAAIAPRYGALGSEVSLLITNRNP